MLIRRMVAAGVLVLLSIGQADARTLDQTPSYLKSEGPFVSYPAIAGATLGGLVGGIIALPAAIIAAPIGYFSGDTLGYAAVPISVTATGGAEVGYHVGGVIPWALKNAFYDAPMYGIAKAKGERPSGTVAEVDPPARDPMLNQYLASTPPAARVPVQLDRTQSLALKPPPELTSLMLKRAMSPFVLPPEVARQFQNIRPVKDIPMHGTPVYTRQPPATASPAAAAAVPSAESPAPAESPVVSPAANPPAAQPVPSPAPQQDAAVSPPSVPVTTAPAPVSSPAPATAAPGPSPDAAPASTERPTLKRTKKKSFSERFGF